MRTFPIIFVCIAAGDEPSVIVVLQSCNEEGGYEGGRYGENTYQGRTVPVGAGVGAGVGKRAWWVVWCAIQVAYGMQRE